MNIKPFNGEHVDQEEVMEVHEEHLVHDEEQQPSGVDVLFSNIATTRVGGQNQLSRTAQLTAHATKLTDQVLQVVRSDPAEWQNKVRASQKSHDAMDDLINEIIVIADEDVSYLDGVGANELEKMLRSQQSKRSRAKSKEMTLDNYRTMMIGAVAENLLRRAMNKPKSAGGYTDYGDATLSDAELEELAKDPERVKKAIRNVQSKKSIMRAKAGFSEDDPKYLQLLAVEAQLKELRDRGNAALIEKARKALEAQETAEQLLSTVNTEELSGEEAKSLLDSIKEMLAGK